MAFKLLGLTANQQAEVGRGGSQSALGCFLTCPWACFKASLGVQLGPSHAQPRPVEKAAMNCGSLKGWTGYWEPNVDSFWHWLSPKKLLGCPKLAQKTVSFREHKSRFQREIPAGPKFGQEKLYFLFLFFFSLFSLLLLCYYFLFSFKSYFPFSFLTLFFLFFPLFLINIILSLLFSF